VILGGVLVWGVITLVRQPRVARRWGPPLAVGLVTLGFTGTLAVWWSTFGWIAWGPRLTLPLLPALVVAAVRAAREPLDAGLRWLVGSTARAIATGVVLVVLAVPQAGVVWNQGAIALPTVPSDSCPVLKAPWETTPDYFYGCGLTAAWRLSPLSLWEAAHKGPWTQQLAQLLQAFTIAGLIAWLHTDVRREREPGREKRRLSSLGA
jgi:hypothetical protein